MSIEFELKRCNALIGRLQSKAKSPNDVNVAREHLAQLARHSKHGSISKRAVAALAGRAHETNVFGRTDVADLIDLATELALGLDDHRREIGLAILTGLSSGPANSATQPWATRDAAASTKAA